MDIRKILVLARRDHKEAMRVASGLTVYDHEVQLVFMTGPVEETAANAEQVELLELSGIEPMTTVREMADQLPLLGVADLAAAVRVAEHVISI